MNNKIILLGLVSIQAIKVRKEMEVPVEPVPEVAVPLDTQDMPKDMEDFTTLLPETGARED